MNTISTNVNPSIDDTIFTNAENKFEIKIREDVQKFIVANAGGFPVKSVISDGEEEYEVRVFLSLDPIDEHYYLGISLDSFLERTKGRIIPIAVDSEENFFCVNNETGNVYYWSSEIDEYFLVSPSLDEFETLFLEA